MKRYTLRCPFCGSEHTKYESLLKIHFIFHNTYTLNCPVCHKKSIWTSQLWLKHDSINKEEQLFNKLPLFDDRI